MSALGVRDSAILRHCDHCGKYPVLALVRVAVGTRGHCPTAAPGRVSFTTAPTAVRVPADRVSHASPVQLCPDRSRVSIAPTAPLRARE